MFKDYFLGTVVPNERNIDRVADWAHKLKLKYTYENQNNYNNSKLKFFP